MSCGGRLLQNPSAENNYAGRLVSIVGNSTGTVSLCVGACLPVFSGPMQCQCSAVAEYKAHLASQDSSFKAGICLTNKRDGELRNAGDWQLNVNVEEAGTAMELDVLSKVQCHIGSGLTTGMWCRTGGKAGFTFSWLI